MTKALIKLIAQVDYCWKPQIQPEALHTRCHKKTALSVLFCLPSIWDHFLKKKMSSRRYPFWIGLVVQGNKLRVCKVIPLCKNGEKALGMPKHLQRSLRFFADNRPMFTYKYCGLYKSLTDRLTDLTDR